MPRWGITFLPPRHFRFLVASKLAGGKVCSQYHFQYLLSRDHPNNIEVDGTSSLQKKNPRILPPRCFLLASSWSMIPPEVVRTTYPNCLEGRRLLVHFSMSPMAMSNLGEMTPHLLRRPVRLTTILPDLWSSTT